jgi:hypothetical protein
MKPVKIIKHKLRPQTNKDGERRRFFLVYQAGIANIFEVDCANLSGFGRNAKRLYQGDFRTAEAIAEGFGLAGGIVHTAACNNAGDITNDKWTDDLDSQPFSEKFFPVFYTVGM